MKTPKKKTSSNSSKVKEVLDKTATIAELVNKSIVIIKDVGIENKPVKNFSLAPAQRDVLLTIPGVPQTVKTKLKKAKASFTHAEVAGMIQALLEGAQGSEGRQQAVFLLVAKHLLGQWLSETAGLAEKAAAKGKESKTKIPAGTIFQFKITLLGIEPSIWRRIQTKDCTLDKLHEHIQTAMGWTNSHLHQFDIEGVRYGDPQLLQVEFQDETPVVSSLRTKLSKVVPKDGKPFSFQYEYDFGDCWEHEILFEGFPPAEKGARYPLCIEGERACPPEDVGGIGGFEEYVKAMANPKHKRHKEFLRWNGPFDPKKFDAQAATKEMRKGVPDWRSGGPI
jgi:hypothetical protein